MNGFPNFGLMDSCKYIRHKEENIGFVDFHSKSSVFRFHNETTDPTEVMFRNILSKISSIDKQLKNFSCPNMKQTTFLNSSPSKQKQSSNYASKKLKKK